ncbi:unnamed protein product, partial [Adineta steineri]
LMNGDSRSVGDDDDSASVTSTLESARVDAAATCAT